MLPARGPSHVGGGGQLSAPLPPALSPSRPVALPFPDLLVQGGLAVRKKNINKPDWWLCSLFNAPETRPTAPPDSLRE